jgi:N-acetylneuraminic acid mutarotase
MEGMGNDSVISYSSDTNSWTPLASLKTGRFACGAAVWGHSLIVIGGSTTATGNIINTCELIDLTTDITASKGWSMTGNMSVARANPAVCSVPDGILVAGGTGVNRTELVSVERWSPVTKKWQLLSWTLPMTMHRCSIHYIDGRLYVVGGNMVLLHPPSLAPSTN